MLVLAKLDILKYFFKYSLHLAAYPTCDVHDYYTKENERPEFEFNWNCSISSRQVQIQIILRESKNSESITEWISKSINSVCQL